MLLSHRSVSLTHRRNFIRLLLCFAFSGGSSYATAQQVKQFDVRGTFSSLRYSREAGDLLGAEIKIVPITRPYNSIPRNEPAFQGALQIAEGVPSEIMIVDIKIEGTRISFSIPDRYPVYGGGKFEGTVDAQAIKGRFTISGVVGDEQQLRRGRGYWDN